LEGWREQAPLGFPTRSLRKNMQLPIQIKQSWETKEQLSSHHPHIAIVSSSRDAE